MMRPMPKIREFMTPAPCVMEWNQSVDDASQTMKRYGIRHLPVRRDGILQGIVSERMVQEARHNPGGRALSVQDVMIPSPFVVAPDEDLDVVAAVMADEKFGCALIQDEGKLIGIFTTVDACRALRQILETHYPQ